jgi:translation initiation factor IF-3
MNGDLRGTPRVVLLGPDDSPSSEPGRVVPLAEALREALAHGLDLVEIDPGASPPVCKLLRAADYAYVEVVRGRLVEDEPQDDVERE